jgi:hypothetical protein
MDVSEDSPDAAVETLAENYARVRAEVTRLVAEVATLTAERDRLREQAARYPVPAFADDLHAFVADALRPYLRECGEEGDESWLVTAEGAGDLADVALTALISAARLPGLADEYVMFEYNLAREQVGRFAEKQLALQATLDELAAAVDSLDGTAGPGEEAHRYLSTACLHATEPGREDLHQECQVDARRYDGTHKVGATCKWCPARCICACHVGLGEDNNG